MAALALQGMKGRVRMVADALIYVAVMVPGIVIGIATLIALVTLFGWINPLLALLAPEGQAPQLAMGYGSLIAAHALFSMSLVIIILRARLGRHGPQPDGGLCRPLRDRPLPPSGR
jgi:spermidine/putrescine transport system permease protein